MGVLGIATALGSALTWGIGSILFARALARRAIGEPLSPAALNLFKNALASAVFLAVFAATEQVWPVRAAWPWLIVSGAFGFALGDTLYFAALPRAGVQIAAMVCLVHVPATVILDRVFLGHALSFATIASMFIVVFGVWLVVSEGPRGSASSSSRRAGVIFALCGALAQAIGVVLGHEGMSGASLFGGTLVRMFGGILGALAAAIVFGMLRGTARTALASLSRPFTEVRLWPALGTAALFASILGLPLFHFALRELPSGVASVLFATTPLFTLPLGYFFGERHGPRAIIGTVIGFVGVACVVRSIS